jgi:hypothetical protein
LEVHVLVDLEKKKQQAGFMMTLWDNEVNGIGNLVHNGITLMREYDNRWDFDEEEGEYLLAWIFTMDSVLVGVPGVLCDVVMNANKFPKGEV